MLKSASIDSSVLQVIDSIKYADQVISVDFRWCQPGEYRYQNTWDSCQFTTYSNIWNATKCNDCPSKATCEGKEIRVDKGYWRHDLLTTDIIECPNVDACLGGYNENNKYPVNCATGYTGILCSEWVVEGDQKYEQISENTCSKCPNPVMNIIRIIGVAILVIIFLVLLIV